MMKNERLRRRLNAPVADLPERDDSPHGLKRLKDALPHIFQYNSLDYFVESNEQGELLVTLCRASNVAPKIRYNIHDNGHVMTFRQLQQILAEEGIAVGDLPKPMANLPIMLHYGRSDLSVGYYGCKITPAEIEKILYESPVLAPVFSSFRLITSEDEQHNKLLTLAIELSRGAQEPADAEAQRLGIFEALAVANQDYRKSAEIAGQSGITPKLEFYGFREGPFVGTDIRLKAKYTEPRMVQGA
jgi:phenylacetate-CoA ligase